MKLCKLRLGDAEFVFFITDSQFENIQLTPPHIHALPELFIVLRGSAELSGDFGDKKITNREVCIIPPKTFHSIVNDEAYTRIALPFFVKKIDGETGGIYDIFTSALSDNTPKINSFNPALIEEFYNCLKYQSSFSQEKFKGLLSLILIESAEQLAESPLPAGKTVFRKKDDYYLRLAESDLDFYLFFIGRIDNTELCRRLFITTRQVSRISLAAYGKNLKSMRNETRMRIARFLLSKTETPTEKIADYLNFSSKESFAITFKRYFSVAPGAVRGKKVK